MTPWLRRAAAALLLLGGLAAVVWLHTPPARERPVAAHPTAGPPRVPAKDPTEDATDPDPDVVAATDEALRAWVEGAKGTPGYLVCDATALADRDPGAGEPPWSTYGVTQRTPSLSWAGGSALRDLDLHLGVLSATTTTPWGSEWVTDAAGRTFRVTWSGVQPGRRGACAVTAWDEAGSTAGPDWRSPDDVVPAHYDPGSREDLAEVEDRWSRRLAAAEEDLARHEALAAGLSGPALGRIERALASERASVEAEAEVAASEQRKLTVYRVLRPVIATTHEMLGLTPPRRDGPPRSSP